jgi:hypothetical protein
MTDHRVALLSILAVLAGCHASGVPVTPATRASSPAGVAPWLVTIVVDQLAAWMADERWALLPDDGGFARLRREGLTVRQLRFTHAITDTAPGHSALFTGVVPHTSGIVANDVISSAGKKISILADARTRLVPVGGAGPIDRPGSSLAALQSDTIADALLAARPDARIFSFSLKDRGALFAGGRHPELVLWLDTEGGTFVTSTAFASSVPGWVVPLGDAPALARARAGVWQPLAPSWLAAHAETADDQAGEGDYLGLGAQFPHIAASVKALRATPAADGLLFDLARAAATLAATKRDGRPVLLALSLSSHDYISHVFGPNSWEAWDELLRLDRQLADLLTALDRLVGPLGYAVMLTGDHGSNPLPELTGTGQGAWCAARSKGGPKDPWGSSCDHGRRLIPSEITAILDTEARAILEDRGQAEVGADPARAGLGVGSAGRTWVAGVAEPFVYLTCKGRALPPAQRAALLRVAQTLLHDKYGVAQVIDVRSSPVSCPSETDESLPALICRSTRRDQPGDFYIVAKPGTFFDPDLATGKGTSHGSPYLYDRTVPLLVRAPGRVPDGTIENGPMSYAAFARTAAALLRVPPPASASTGPDLTSATR